MKDSTSAIQDIIEAIYEYGSSIVILTTTDEVTDAYGEVITKANIDRLETKALIGRNATDKVTQKLTEDILNGYDLSMRLYTSKTFNKTNTIEFRDNEYNIVYIDEMILQDDTLMYEILVKK